MPPPSSAERAAAIGTVAGWIAELRPGRLRVAIDGLTGAGKTSFGHELAAALRALGRPTMRASMDDFKHPWRHAREHGYDRVSGAAAPWVIFAGAAIIFISLSWPLSMSSADYRREPPMPPGAPSSGS